LQVLTQSVPVDLAVVEFQVFQYQVCALGEAD